MGALDIGSLTKVYGSGADAVTAVEDIDLTIEDGGFLILVGPSGCGKSTTLRCIAGLESVTDGDIQFGDRSVVRERPSERDIAMVFQNYALYPHMTARDNMSFGLRMSTDMDEEEVERKVTDVAELMGIKDLLDDKPSELSGGQQQRVALGRAIVREPEVFLLDEPLSNLDAKLRTQMRTEFQDLQQQLGITTVYVTHDQTEAMTMGDKIAVMNHGELQQLGTPLECYHEPANTFVAGFIGSPSMNFFDVRYDGRRLENPNFEYALSEDTRQHLGDEAMDLHLGVRPEDVDIVEEPGENTIATEVSVVEPMGDLTLLYVNLGDETLTVQAQEDILVDSGETVHVRFPEYRLHLFDGETGGAILNNREKGSTIAEYISQ